MSVFFLPCARCGRWVLYGCCSCGSSDLLDFDFTTRDAVIALVSFVGVTAFLTSPMWLDWLRGG